MDFEKFFFELLFELIGEEVVNDLLKCDLVTKLSYRKLLITKVERKSLAVLEIMQFQKNSFKNTHSNYLQAND